MPLFNVRVRDDFGYSVRHIGSESPLGVAEVVEDYLGVTPEIRFINFQVDFFKYLRLQPGGDDGCL